MGCANPPNERDDRMLEESREGKNCNLDPNIEKSFKDIEKDIDQKVTEMRKEEINKQKETSQKLLLEKKSEVGQSQYREFQNIIRNPQAEGHKEALRHLGEDWGVRGWACKKLNIHSAFSMTQREASFTPPYHGFDHIGVAKDGKIVVFQAKCYLKDPPKKEGLEQLTKEYLDKTFARMSNPNSKQYSDSNKHLAELAKEKGVVRYLFHMGVNSKTAKVYLVKDDPKTGEPVPQLILEANAKDITGKWYPIYFGSEEESNV